MKLVRNTDPNGICKYAVLRLDKMRKDGRFDEFMHLMQTRTKDPNDSGYFKYVEVQKIDDPEESFLIKLKDKFAPWALTGYASGIQHHIDSLTDPKEVAEWSEFAEDVRKLSDRAYRMANRKLPD